jgi:predicted nucleic-acid-binding Zn-ribbon protein
VLKRRIRELNCSVEHFKGKSISSTKYELKDILIKDSQYTAISRLKDRLIKEGLLKYKCSKCGISEWQNEPISL